MVEFDQLTVVLLVTGDDPPELTEAEADALQDAHMAHLADLHDQGSLLAAGPLLDPARRFRGLSLLNAEPDEARALKEADPAVQAGLFRLEILPWLVPQGAMAFSHTHLPRSMAEVSD